MNALLEKKHQRYQMQAEWTKPFRQYLYQKLPENKPLSILEIGCGTGVILKCVREELSGRIESVIGADFDRSVLCYASVYTKDPLVQCIGEKLAFPEEKFDFVYCNYLLLWVKDPDSILREMFRVTKTGGICAVMAEPDYDQMTAEPEALYQLAERQKQALMAQGAYLNAGKNLGKMFYDLGFSFCDSGKYKQGAMTPEAIDREISQMLEDCGIKEIDIDKSTKKVYNVPTYYAYGIK